MITSKFYNAYYIAKICGIYSKNNNPHDKFVSEFLKNKSIKTESRPIYNNYGKVVNYNLFYESQEAINLIKKYVLKEFNKIYEYEEFEETIILNKKEYIVKFIITDNAERNYLRAEREGIQFENVLGDFKDF